MDWRQTVRRNNSYSLQNLAGIFYLLPYGQTQADLHPGIRLNETGAFLWKLLEKDRSRDELLAACAERYHASAEELPLLQKDIAEFLQTLSRRFLLTETPEIPRSASAEKKYLSIAGLTLCLEGPADAFPEQFGLFETDKPTSIHQRIALLPGAPGQRLNGNLLIRSENLVAMETEDRYIFLFPQFPQIEEAHLSLDGSQAVFYYLPPCTDTLREELFHGIRLLFLCLAGQHGMAVVHSASVLYRGKAWLFSGPSGTGKSTHAALWNRVCNAPTLNGDLNLLALDNGLPVVCGLPWCGTSGICSRETYPLGGIILLRQAPADRIEALSPDQKLLLVQQRLITPSWTERMLEQNLRTVEKLLPDILVCRLRCTVNDTAVSVMRNRIDGFLDGASP